MHLGTANSNPDMSNNQFIPNIPRKGPSLNRRRTLRNRIVRRIANPPGDASPLSWGVLVTAAITITTMVIFAIVATLAR